MTKDILTFSASSGLKIEIKKGRFYQIWIGTSKKPFSKYCSADTEEKARILVDGIVYGYSLRHNQ